MFCDKNNYLKKVCFQSTLTTFKSSAKSFHSIVFVCFTRDLNGLLQLNISENDLPFFRIKQNETFSQMFNVLDANHARSISLTPKAQL